MTKKRTSQIDVRCTPDEKETIYKAVKQINTTVTDFLIKPGVKKANKILKTKN